MTSQLENTSGGQAPVWVDDRWRGTHGIGRYAAEVTSRLSLPWKPLGLSGAPSSPQDAFRRVPAAARGALVYSPGYNALPSAKRQVLTIHDLIHLQTPWPGRAKYLAYYNAVVRPVVRRNKVVLTVSETSKRAIQEWVNDDSVDVVNAGIGCSSAFTPGGAVAESNEPYVFYVGNLRRHKNLKTVLRAIAALPDSRIRAVVPTAELADARKLASAVGATGQVEWLSGIDDEGMAMLYRGAAATVMPSTLEGFGLPALESVMTGTPVIYWSGCLAVAETVGSFGFAVDSSHDMLKWRDAIDFHLRSGARVTPIAPEVYGWDVTSMKIQKLLVNIGG